MKPKYRYHKYVKWGARQILLEIAKHIDENNLIDIDVAEEIKAYARHEAKAEAAARTRFTWER